mgnify:CR=1 FL=1
MNKLLLRLHHLRMLLLKNLNLHLVIHFQDLIQKINDEGNTILVVTHEEDIAHMCKRIVHLKDGVIVEDKKIEQVRAEQYV